MPSEGIEPPSIRQVTPEEGREVLRGLIEDYQRLSSDEPPRCRHAAAGATGPVLFCVLPRGHDEPHRDASGAEWTERLTDVQ